VTDLVETIHRVKAPEPEGVRTYEIELADGGAIRVDIPETYKVTYGPVIGPGAKGSGGTAAYGSGNAFRAWENENRQRLLLTGVVGFRDISLPMKRRAVRKFGTETWMADDGKWTGQKSLEVQKSWVDIDQIDERPAEDEDSNQFGEPPFKRSR
jgi:hypothetical protein